MMPFVERWLEELEAGRPEVAWDAFLERYRKLLFASIRHYVRDHDDVMDAFTRVCEGLRENDLRRLRAYADDATHRARFSTWLVVVVRNLCVDWLRARHGRARPAAIAERLSPLQRRIYERVFVLHHGHAEAYEEIRSRERPDLTFGDYLRELRAVYRIVSEVRGPFPRELFAPPPPPSHVDPGPIGDGEARTAVAETLAFLSPTDRAAVLMYVVDGVPAAEVAELLGLPNAKAVYNRVYRGLAAMRKELERAGLRREDLVEP